MKIAKYVNIGHLLFHGIRIDELINLQWSMVEEEYDEDDGYIYRFTYIGKGVKERSLDFPVAFISNNLEIKMLFKWILIYKPKKSSCIYKIW